MIRYTTPTISLSFEDLDLAQVSILRIVFKQKGKGGFKKEYKVGEVSAVTIVGSTAEVKLTAEETASLDEGKVQIQGHIKLTDGTILSTNIVTLPVVENLDEDTMEDD